MKSARRLRSETVSIPLHVGEGVHHLDLTLAYDAKGILHELSFVTRGKVGHGMDQLLVNLGIAVSRAIQGRNPETGEPEHA